MADNEILKDHEEPSAYHERQAHRLPHGGAWALFAGLSFVCTPVIAASPERWKFPLAAVAMTFLALSLAALTRDAIHDRRHAQRLRSRQTSRGAAAESQPGYVPTGRGGQAHAEGFGTYSNAPAAAQAEASRRSTSGAGRVGSPNEGTAQVAARRPDTSG
jgi:hypothetical protein